MRVRQHPLRFLEYTYNYNKHITYNEPFNILYYAKT